MKTRTLPQNSPSQGTIKRESSYLAVFVGVLFLIGLGIFGCKGTTISPTGPSSVGPLPSPSPTATATPDSGTTTSPTSEGYDNYGETPNDPNIETLDPDGNPYTVTMDYTGDIDWYKIRIPTNTQTLKIALTNIPPKSDFDIVAYDADLKELPNGRSAQSGNTSEKLSLSSPDSLIYLQIYSYSGRGDAVLTLTTEETAQNNIIQLTYEDVLSTYYPLYPRGTSSGLLVRSVESIKLEQITCQTSSGVLSGDLTIGNYAHVERELMTSEDYIDGWVVVVFNGPVSVLDNLTVTIQITIFAPALNLEIKIPSEMTLQGSRYLISATEDDVYYISQSYGDFWGNTSDDIRISSGVVGDLGDLFSNNIFTQQVEVEWTWRHSNRTTCSGKTTGKQIVDFEIGNPIFLRGQMKGLHRLPFTQF